YWIDNEVFKLIKNYKNISNFDNNNIRYIPENVKLKAFESPTSSFRGELEIGYCSDSLIRCEAKECMLYSNWRIDLNDLKVKLDQILKNIINKQNNHMELIKYNYKIHTNTAITNMTPDNLENEKDLDQTLLKNKSDKKNITTQNQIARRIY